MLYVTVILYLGSFAITHLSKSHFLPFCFYHGHIRPLAKFTFSQTAEYLSISRCEFYSCYLFSLNDKTQEFFPKNIKVIQKRRNHLMSYGTRKVFDGTPLLASVLSLLCALLCGGYSQFKYSPFT